MLTRRRSRRPHRARIRGCSDKVRAWIASESTAPLDLPPVNGYLRRVTYEQISTL